LFILKSFRNCWKLHKFIEILVYDRNS
jgi:hypothetical protein